MKKRYLTLAAALSCSPAAAVSLVQPYTLVRVSTDDKLYGALIYGEIMIHVDTMIVDEALATADEVAHQLIDSGTLDAVRVFAFTPRQLIANDEGRYEEKNGTAWVAFSGHPDFMSNWGDWLHEVKDGDLIVETEFDRTPWVVPAEFTDPSVTLRRICNDLRRCRLGDDPREIFN